jgi:hypothetical protein
MLGMIMLDAIVIQIVAKTCLLTRFWVPVRLVLLTAHYFVLEDPAPEPLKADRQIPSVYLHYPTGKKEEFPLVRPCVKDEYDPIDDMLGTMRVLCAEFPEMFVDEFRTELKRVAKMVSAVTKALLSRNGFPVIASRQSTPQPEKPSGDRSEGASPVVEAAQDKEHPGVTVAKRIRRLVCLNLPRIFSANRGVLLFLAF